jgi:hypothetical protein
MRILKGLSLSLLLTPALLAQDSVGKAGGFPGDALDPLNPNEQVNDFIVDLSTFKSSWGNTFGMAPIAKASDDHTPAPTYYNAQMSGQVISKDTLINVPFARASYDMWNASGAGVNQNSQVQDPGQPVDTSTHMGHQFGFGFAEWSSDPTDTYSFNHMISGVVNWEPNTPGRLYVSRITAAVNGDAWNCNLSQYGMGGVGGDGYLAFRGDGYGSGPCGTSTELLGNNYFGVRSLQRANGTLNVISNSGGTDAGATVWHLAGSPTTHNTCTLIPSSITGGSPIILGSNFNSEYRYGTGTSLSTTNVHLGASGDHRGNVSQSFANLPAFLPGSVLGTGAIIGQNGIPDTMALWGLDASGAPVSPLNLTLPAVITDNSDGWASNALGSGTLSFGNFASQVAYRGGNGQIAVGSDDQGRLLSCALAHHPQWTSNDDGNNLLAVCRLDASGSEDWTIAGYTANASGKAILDAGGNTIGNLVALGTFSTASGPSMSSPMMDSGGNIFFTSAIQTFDATGAPDYGLGLIRAEYDSANFEYKLELVLRSGGVFHGHNSTHDYQVRFFKLADSNSIDSGAAFSGNISAGAANGQAPHSVPSGSVDSLGGLVLSLNILYDVNGDGQFTSYTTDPASPDEDYNVLMYIGVATDCNGNGLSDELDLANGTSQDLDGDGVPDECASGASFCFGDGSGAFCPCGNFGGTGEGCANGTGSGALMTSLGSNSVSTADFGLAAANLDPSQPGLYFQGNNAVNGGQGNAFGDGLRCAGGAVVRLQVRFANASGASSTTANLVLKGGVAPGDTKRYQLWYRNPSTSPCGAQFNLSNGVEMVFTP